MKTFMFICDRLPLITLTQWGRCPKGESDEGSDPRWGPVPLGPTAAHEPAGAIGALRARRKPLRSIMMNR